MKLIKQRPAWNLILARAVRSSRLVYGSNTCWWKLGDPVYNHREARLPCGPRGEMLLETDKPVDFLKAAEANPSHYGKHGLDAFIAAYHGFVTTDDGRPTSLDSWDAYNDLIDQEVSGSPA